MGLAPLAQGADPLSVTVRSEDARRFAAVFEASGGKPTAEDLQVVQSMGIKATTVYAASWVIASVVGVIGGILLGGVSGANMDLALIGLKAFAVVLLGGVNSIGGAIIAGIILGMLENVAAGYLDPLLPGGGLAQVFPFFVMIIVLVFRPHGLFGLAHIERV